MYRHASVSTLNKLYCAFFSWPNDAVFESSLETARSVFIKQWAAKRFVAYG